MNKLIGGVMNKLIVLVVILFVMGSSPRNETKEYIEWLGDRAVDLSIGGDADAYRTLEWAKDQEDITKEKLEKHYKSYEEKRKEKQIACKGKTTEGYEYHCSGYWYTFTHDGKIYNCLPQVDSGKLYKDDICYNEKKYACHVNSDDVTDEKIEESCNFNNEIDDMMNEVNALSNDCFANGGGWECLTYGGIPKRMEKQ